jgi:hypothetical protein
LSIQLNGQQCPVCLAFIRSKQAYSRHAAKHFGGVSTETPQDAYTPPVPIEKALKMAAKLRGGHPTSAFGHRELASTVLLKRRMKVKKKSHWNDSPSAILLLSLVG